MKRDLNGISKMDIKANQTTLKALEHMEAAMLKLRKMIEKGDATNDQIVGMSERLAKLGMSAARLRASMNLIYTPWEFSGDKGTDETKGA